MQDDAVGSIVLNASRAPAQNGDLARRAEQQERFVDPHHSAPPTLSVLSGRAFRCGLGTLAIALCAPTVLAQSTYQGCGDLQNAYGPYDYRSEQNALKVVEGFHFSQEVELLIRGKTGSLGDDLDYVLRASPNHHRALVAMTRLTEREKTQQPKGARYSMECYYERAVRFAKNDTVARSLYASYLSKQGREAEALAQLEYTAKLAPDNGFTQYNIGLIYLEMKKYDRALMQAHRAMELGFLRPDLATQLKQLGAWREPEPVTSDAAASAPAATKP